MNSRELGTGAVVGLLTIANPAFNSNAEAKEPNTTTLTEDDYLPTPGEMRDPSPVQVGEGEEKSILIALQAQCRGKLGRAEEKRGDKLVELFRKARALQYLDPIQQEGTKEKIKSDGMATLGRCEKNASEPGKDGEKRSDAKITDLVAACLGNAIYDPLIYPNKSPRIEGIAAPSPSGRNPGNDPQATEADVAKCIETVTGVKAEIKAVDSWLSRIGKALGIKRQRVVGLKQGVDKL